MTIDDPAGGAGQPRAVDCEQTLCVDCGLCCDSTLFRRVRLTPADVVTAGLPQSAVTDEGGEQFTAQPCRFLAGAACTIYARRFAACRRFRCDLLDDLRDGYVALSTATARVVEAKRLRDAWRSTSTIADGEPVAAAMAKLRRATLDMFIARHFRRRRAALALRSTSDD